MPGESTGVGTLAVAAPVIAIVGAAFMGCCTLAAISFTASSAYDTATILLIAGLPAFGLSQAVALAFGIVAFANCIRGKAVGLPEAILGIVAACFFIISALYLLQQATKTVVAQL